MLVVLPRHTILEKIYKATCGQTLGGVGQMALMLGHDW